jgi:RND family efflux transporter MFP subunit
MEDMMSHRPRLPRFCRLAPALLLLAAGCTAAAPPKLPPPIVTVSVPLQQPVTDYLDFTGQTAAAESVQVRPRVGGYLDKVNYTEGKEVTKDQVLFEIDPRPFQNEVDRAQAEVKRAETRLKQAEAVYQRSVQLRKTGSVSEEDLEKDLRTRDVAEAALDAGKANVRAMQLNLDFTKVQSPIDGRAEKANITAGNLVTANPIDATLLTTVVALKPIYVYFDVDELTLLRIQRLAAERKAQPRGEKALPVRVGLVNGTDFPFEGTIDFVGNQVNAAKGTVQVRGVFPNEDGALSPGLQARVRVPLHGAGPALLVTERALVTLRGQKYLYLVNSDNEVVVSPPVRVGVVHEGLAEIEHGLAPTDRVIINGLMRVRPGDKVDPQPGKMAADAAKAGAPAASPEAK